MTDPGLIRSLGLMVIAAAVLTLLGRRARVPSIVSYIVAGLLLGPLTGVLEVTDSIHVIGEVGIALLLFVVGLELSLDKIRDVGRVAVIVGLVQMGGTLLLGLGLALVLGFAFTPALLLAIALSFSSTVVVVKLLDHQKELHQLHGRIAVGILLLQDLAVILVLTFLAGIEGQETLEASTLVRGLGTAFGGMGVLLVAALLASRYVLPGLFRWIAPAADALLVWSLFWCFLFVLLAQVLSLSPEIGAFLAGISLAQLPYSHALRRRVHPLMNFFIAIFFVSLGVEMELEAALNSWGVALALGLFVVISRILLLTPLLAHLGHTPEVAFGVGVTLSQISEFSLILMALAHQVGLIGTDILALVALVALGTIAVSSYLIIFRSRIQPLALRLGLRRWSNQQESTEEDELHDHVVVVGMNSLGQSLVERLVVRGLTVVAIDSDPHKVAGLRCRTLVGNAEELSLLEEAGLPHARLLISALNIEDTNYLLAYRAGQFGVAASIHAFDQSVVDELREVGVSHLMMSKHTGLRQLARELQALGVLRG